MKSGVKKETDFSSYWGIKRRYIDCGKKGEKDGRIRRVFKM